MARSGRTTLIGRVYDNVELGLWAMLVAGLIVFVAFVAPGVPAAQQRNAAEQLAAFEHECSFYCSRWGMAPGTRQYTKCMADLHQFRDSIVKQAASDDF
ncbi:MAG TPA: hypothetical protein VN655_17810 [Pseudolabrys sp.]|jgi:hypothetical protein|nr:hypothetical protein [Pseudolabrys sp.]